MSQLFDGQNQYPCLLRDHPTDPGRSFCEPSTFLATYFGPEDCGFAPGMERYISVDDESPEIISARVVGSSERVLVRRGARADDVRQNCQPRGFLFFTTQRVYRVEETFNVDDLPIADVQTVTVNDRVVAKMLIADEGRRALIELEDTASGVCQAQWVDQALRCTPESARRTVTYEGLTDLATCTATVVSSEVYQQGNIVDVVQARTTLSGFPRDRLVQSTVRLDAVPDGLTLARHDGSGACTAVTSTQTPPLFVTTPFSSSEWAQLPSAAPTTGRLQQPSVRVPGFEDLIPLYVSFLDTQLDARCDLGAVDGQLRCVPNAGRYETLEPSLWSNSTCLTPLVYPEPDQRFLSLATTRDSMAVGIFDFEVHRLAATGSVYARGPGPQCQRVGTSPPPELWVPGPSLPSQDFAPLDYQLE